MNITYMEGLEIAMYIREELGYNIGVGIGRISISPIMDWLPTHLTSQVKTIPVTKLSQEWVE